jgi:hypothetical protein
LIGRLRPPRLARSGRAASAASAVPKRVSSWRTVIGPTFSERISRSIAKRSAEAGLFAEDIINFQFLF